MKNGQGAGYRGEPVRVEASPYRAPRLRFGSAALSFFRSLWSAWVTLFLFLEAWADLAQEESHQAVAIVFHYLKIGGKRVGFF